MSDLDELAAAAKRRSSPPRARPYVQPLPPEGAESSPARTAGTIGAIIGTIIATVGLKYDDVDLLRIGVVIACVALLLFALGRGKY